MAKIAEKLKELKSGKKRRKKQEIKKRKTIVERVKPFPLIMGPNRQYWVLIDNTGS